MEPTIRRTRNAEARPSTWPRALAVTAVFLAADWCWWAYGVAGRVHLGTLRGHKELGESTAQHIRFEALWRLPITFVCGAIGLVAVYFLMREQSEMVAPARGFEYLRIYLGALILLMLMRVLGGMMLGVLRG